MFDKELKDIYDELQPKRVRQALKGALSSEGRRIVKMVRQEIRATSFNGRPMRNARGVSKVARVSIRRDLTSFSVKVSAGRGGRGMYLNSHGKLKPVAVFMTSGATGRKTNRGANRGNLAKQSWIERVKTKTDNEVGQRLGQALEQQIRKKFSKYGSN
jgi:hypothetical protein